MDTTIVADEGLLAKVRAISSPTTHCDQNGNLVAVVVPPALYKDLLLSWSESHFRPELAQQAWQDYQQDGGRSTAEVLEWLKSLDTAPDNRS